ncbi:MAG TPA: DUF4956 domain-containing protein [Gemmatimonadaceae bacterium]|nr:DUF4956 domain-containing protein [Gemmatimonadaceae bacterium]
MAPLSGASRFFGNVVVRVVLYYAALLGAAIAAVLYLPDETIHRVAPTGAAALEALGGTASAAARPHDPTATPLGALTAMGGAVLLALPVAWVYVLTRAKRGFQQSVVQTLVILPLVVAGVVALVKDSLPLAFGLAGIVAAVRFRTALDDSKDAVYVFLATGVGLASAIDLRIAAVVSVVFNLVVLLLWATDFGRAPAALDGLKAERRLQRAMEQMSRTGTFVARIDKEVFEDMSAEQLQAVADRAWRRARRNNPEAPDAEGRREALLQVRAYEVESTRRAIEPLLDEHLKRWRFGGVVHEPQGVEVLEYTVLLRKGGSQDELLDALRTSPTADVLDAQLR